MSVPDSNPTVPGSARPSTARVLAIGCFASWVGALSGAMVAVLVSTGVAYVTRAPSCDGIPSCDWYIYAAVGAAIGMLTLPWLVVSALRRPSASPAATPDDQT